MSKKVQLTPNVPSHEIWVAEFRAVNSVEFAIKTKWVPSFALNIFCIIPWKSLWVLTVARKAEKDFGVGGQTEALALYKQDRTFS